MSTGHEVIRQEDGFPVFDVTWEASGTVINFTVHEVENVDASWGEGSGELLNLGDKLLEIGIKWDGCSNVNYGDEWHHFCGVQGLQKFLAMQVWLYAKAADLLIAEGCDYPKSNADEFLLEVQP